MIENYDRARLVLDNCPFKSCHRGASSDAKVVRYWGTPHSVRHFAGISFEIMSLQWAEDALHHWEGLLVRPRTLTRVRFAPDSEAVSWCHANVLELAAGNVRRLPGSYSGAAHDRYSLTWGCREPGSWEAWPFVVWSARLPCYLRAHSIGEIDPGGAFRSASAQGLQRRPAGHLSGSAHTYKYET